MTAVEAVLPASEQSQRMEALLATVTDIMSSLSTAHSALEKEVRLALERRVTDPGPVSVERKSVLAQLALENAQLREAMESRAVIEQAKGVLIGRHGCDPDQAFELLAAMSRRQRRKIRQVAAWVVEQAMAHALPDGKAGARAPGRPRGDTADIL